MLDIYNVLKAAEQIPVYQRPTQQHPTTEHVGFHENIRGHFRCVDMDCLARPMSSAKRYWSVFAYGPDRNFEYWNQPLFAGVLALGDVRNQGIRDRIRNEGLYHWVDYLGSAGSEAQSSWWLEEQFHEMDNAHWRLATPTRYEPRYEHVNDRFDLHARIEANWPREWADEFDEGSEFLLVSVPSGSFSGVYLDAEADPADPDQNNIRQNWRYYGNDAHRIDYFNAFFLRTFPNYATDDENRIHNEWTRIIP